MLIKRVEWLVWMAIFKLFLSKFNLNWRFTLNLSNNINTISIRQIIWFTTFVLDHVRVDNDIMLLSGTVVLVWLFWKYNLFWIGFFTSLLNFCSKIEIIKMKTWIDSQVKELLVFYSLRCYFFGSNIFWNIYPKLKNLNYCVAYASKCTLERIAVNLRRLTCRLWVSVFTQI